MVTPIAQEKFIGFGGLLFTLLIDQHKCGCLVFNAYIYQSSAVEMQLMVDVILFLCFVMI
jgi:hypothetical protein